MSERRARRPPPRAARAGALTWRTLATGAWWAFLAVVVPTGVWTLLDVLPCAR